MGRQQYHVCDYQLIGSCLNCLTDYPGNWFLTNEEDMTTCCVADPYDVKFPRTRDINSTDDCPEVFFIKAAGFGLVGLGVIVCISALALFGKWMCGRFCKKSTPQEEGIEMQDVDRAAGTAVGVDRLENTGMDSGDDYQADDENSSPSASSTLNMMAYEDDNLFNVESDENEMETSV